VKGASAFDSVELLTQSHGVHGFSPNRFGNGGYVTTFGVRLGSTGNGFCQAHVCILHLPSEAVTLSCVRTGTVSTSDRFARCRKATELEPCVFPKTYSACTQRANA
jgi:hypothetical protein